MNSSILTYISEHRQEAYDLLLELARIPAPSNHEEKRAQFCRSWLEKQGAKGVYIDKALNVVYPVGCRKDKELVVFMAHTDVVFPDTDALPLEVADGKVWCPGVGDDTANLAALLMVAKYVAEQEIEPSGVGILFVANSGEEGLGNLKGCRRIMEDFGHRVREFVTFDGYAERIANTAVGSHRYRIEIDTEGGHSYSKFGNRNAIAYLASMIDTLYNVKVPEKGRTTYNVGTVSGGTSVNTIAQHAEMLYEYRSDHRDSLAFMKQHLESVIAFYRAKGVRVTVTMVGDRPCGGDVDETLQKALSERAADAIRRHYGVDPVFGSGSTDCNIPLSMGIPSVCVSCVTGGGAHTREEYVDVDSLEPGLRVAFEMILRHF